MTFHVEDLEHFQPRGHSPTWEAALLDLERMARVPWGTHPNHLPCTTGSAGRRSWWIVKEDGEPDQRGKQNIRATGVEFRWMA